jgi:hypothetical protein
MTHKKYKKARRKKDLMGSKDPNKSFQISAGNKKNCPTYNEEGFRDNSLCIYKMIETEFSPAYPKWCFYHNIKNYTDMPSCVRGSYKKLLYNRNNIEFDKKNKNMLRWEDKLHEVIENELYDRNEKKLENDTFLFMKHLIFIDTDTKRGLHKKIRYEIFEREDMDNLISDNEDFSVETDDEDF